MRNEAKSCNQANSNNCILREVLDHGSKEYQRSTGSEDEGKDV